MEQKDPPLSPYSTGLRGRCPHCGDGPLFEGFIKAAPSCSVCGLDFAFIDSGDGPAVFVIMIVGFVVVAGALATEMLYQPPLWVTAAIWLPLTVIIALGVLRPLKGVLIALQYVNKAAEGRLEDR